MSFALKKPILVALLTLSLTTLACVSVIPSSVQTPTPVPALPTETPAPTSSLPEPETSSLLGVDVPIAGAEHIQEGTVATDWNSDPPTSGQHYPQWAPAGFYTEAIPDGYLVHNMEHGYVIVYYNCELAEDCTAFKADIEAAIAAAGNDPNTQTVKVISVPRAGMSTPVTYASWGHLYQPVAFVPAELTAYIQTYRSNPAYAPEWSLP
ncbi:MAG: hypothetical protein Fur0022_13510 [Anaerolineales bacterium]